MPFLRKTVFLALPLTFPVLISTTVARLLVPLEQQPEESSPQEELQELIEAGEQEGLIDKTEGELLQSVVEFGDKVAREVMTPRPELAAIEVNASIEELRRLMREHRYTRYPVYSGQLDRIEGIISVRDLIELPPEEQTKVNLRALVRPVHFVPETKRIGELLKELQQSPMQMAMVVDEYGSISGLVTIEDLLEEIVGEIRDETEPHERDIVRESGNTYLVAGQTELAQLSEKIRLSLEGGDYSTVSGLMLTHLGRVPAPGERLEKDGLIFEVVEANARTVLKVRVHLPSTLPQAASTHAGPRPV